MTGLIERQQLQSALWRSQNFWRGNGLDLDAAAAAVASELTMPVVLGLMDRGLMVTDFSAVEERIRVRVRAMLERVTEGLVEDGHVVEGVEGATERALDALMRSLEGNEETGKPLPYTGHPSL